MELKLINNIKESLQMKPPNRNIIRAMKKCNGHLGNTATTLGVTYATLWNWINCEEELQVAKKEERMKRVGIAVDALMERIAAGDTTAIIFFLKTQCKDSIDEDFSERRELQSGINIIAQNAQINNNTAELKSLSTDKLRELQKLLEESKIQGKEHDTHTKQIDS